MVRAALFLWNFVNSMTFFSVTMVKGLQGDGIGVGYRCSAYGLSVHTKEEERMRLL